MAYRRFQPFWLLDSPLLAGVHGTRKRIRPFGCPMLKSIITVLTLMFAASPAVAGSGWTCSVRSGAGKDSITKYDVIGQDLAESNFDSSLGRWQVEDTFSNSRRLSILQNDADALIAVHTETLNVVFARLILIQKRTGKFRELSTQLSSPASPTQSIDGLCEPADESK